MKIPMISLTALEIGLQSPIVKDGITYARRWLGKTIAGTNTTRKDFAELKDDIAELRELIKNQEKADEIKPNDRLDDSPVRTDPICNQPGPTGPLETGFSAGDIKKHWPSI
tara:strand:- start:584 stop:916 length:333 start_codon:yes stop_codon:yes gene_type:complete